MIEKFNGIIYLVVFIIHFIGYGVYAYQMIINNKKFREKCSSELIQKYPNSEIMIEFKSQMSMR